MKVPLSQLASLTGGVVVGDASRVVEKVAPLHTADSVSITFAEKPEKVDWNSAPKAAAVVLPQGSSVVVPDDVAKLFVESPKAAFERIAAFFHPKIETLEVGVSPKASIASSARIGQNVSIGAFAVVGENVEIADGVKIYPGVVLMANVRIGANTVLFPNVVVYENVRIGANCILHANSVLGAYGFGYDSSTGVHVLAAQYGSVVVEDNVEIGACSTVDRGAYDATYIGEGSKIDNHVMIAHNCKLGKRNMICASVGIAGSVSTGDYVVMAGRVGMRDHLTVGDGAMIGAMAGVMANVPAQARIVGIPATPEKEQMRKQAALAKLPETLKDYRKLRKEVAELESRIAALEQACGDDPQVCGDAPQTGDDEPQAGDDAPQIGDEASQT